MQTKLCAAQNALHVLDFSFLALAKFTNAEQSPHVRLVNFHVETSHTAGAGHAGAIVAGCTGASVSMGCSSVWTDG